jgi:branched-chain amino acid transport system ATP-binding protein
MNRQIGGCKSHAIVELGISHIPEGRKLFQDMTVRENLEMGAYPKRVWNQRHAIIEAVFQMLPLLKIRQSQVVSTMSGGEQQMVAMGRGLMSKPKLCMIDEPSSGLAPLVVKEVFEIIKRLRDDGIAVFLIEQDVQQTLEIADRAYVLENGRITLSGKSRGLLEEDLIKTAYLGL